MLQEEISLILSILYELQKPVPAQAHKKNIVKLGLKPFKKAGI
jgi:hypothetical protein